MSDNHTNPATAGVMSRDVTEVRLRNLQHGHFLLHANSLRRAGMLCDTVLQAGGRTFWAHRLVLACASRKLERMFTGWPEDGAEFQRCSLDNISSRTFGQILQFVYGEVLEVPIEDVAKLQDAAQLLEIRELGEQCRALQQEAEDEEQQEEEETLSHPHSLALPPPSRGSVITSPTPLLGWHPVAPPHLRPISFHSIPACTFPLLPHTYAGILQPLHTSVLPPASQMSVLLNSNKQTKCTADTEDSRKLQRSSNQPQLTHSHHTQFLDSHQLPTHAIIHTGPADLLPCVQCGKRFLRSPCAAWERVCVSCNRGLSTQRRIRSRVEARREHVGEKPHQCAHCPKRFSLKHQLETHNRVHTGEKPFECRLCGQRSRDYSAMIKHLRTHGGAAPYQCTVCLEYCNSLAAMQKHVKGHQEQDFPQDWSISNTYMYTCHT